MFFFWHLRLGLRSILCDSPLEGATVSIDVQQMDRSALAQSVTSTLRPASRPWSFATCEVCVDGRTMVWKDAGAQPWAFRIFFGAVLRREARALLALSSMPEVPALIGMVGRHGFVMEKMVGVRLPRRKHGGLSAEFFRTLKSALRRMNDLGVVHGDLRRKNILYDPETEQPVLVDFGTAIVARENSSWLRWSCWRKTRRVDRVRFAKMKEYYLPGSLSEGERAWLAEAPWYYRLGSLIRSQIYRRLKWRNLRKSLGRE